MLYLSKLVLDPSQPEARRLLGDFYRMHARLLRAWNDDKGGRVLFRTEDDRRPPRVLVQSLSPPDWDRAFPGDELLAESPEVRAFEPELRAGDRFRFLLRANPTKRLPGGRAVEPSTGRQKDGKRVGLERPEDQEAWLRRQGEVRKQPDGASVGGFQVESVAIRRSSEQVSWARRGGRLTHQGVDFHGVLRVTDAAAFSRTLALGVGAAKGFGFGLLSLARWHP